MHSNQSVLNNTTDLTSCLALLNTVQIQLQTISSKTEKLIFIFEKMPPWLSSSSNSAPAATSSWSVLNTKPPASWANWQAMVTAITNKIITQFGISNAYFEVWNEPDLGSWTGTMQEYFTLYKTTFDGVKSVSINAKVGGPSDNFWANNIYWQAKYGHISNAVADSSLIGQLLDSSVIWNKIPDFISWHNFNLNYQEFSNASKYINQKLVTLNLPSITLIVSEWNAPSAVRDTRLANSFMIKAQLEMSKTVIQNNAIAAWQDFEPSVNEFHNDYGLLSYGGIHKPAYVAILLSNILKNNKCKTTSTQPFDAISSVSNDTLSVLISNYCPPPFLEAFNHVLFQNNLNANQLDSAGYINIATNNPLRLDSIFKKTITIPSTNFIEIAINNAIPIYAHFDSISKFPRQFKLKINNFVGNYSSQFYLLDSNHNNQQFVYDSLRNAGFTQNTAISALVTNQNLYFTTLNIVNSLR